MRLILRRTGARRSLGSDPLVHELIAAATAEGARLGHPWIGTEHLLIALAADEGRTGTALRKLGIEPEDIRAELKRAIPPAIDSQALATIGIDLEAVEKRVEEAFGPGALHRRDCRPVMRRLKRAFERAAELAGERGATITRADVLMGLMGVHDAYATRLLNERGITATHLLDALS